MSALNDDIGGKLSALVEVQRGMSPSEARDFLITGVMPDLSRPPPEEVEAEDLEELTETDARQWLGAITAAGDLGSPTVEMVFDPNQPRDHRGRWIGMPGIGGVVGDLPAGRLSSQRRPLTKPQDVLNAAPISLSSDDKISCRPPSMTVCSDSSADDRTQAMLAYRSYSYDMMNSMLRGTYDEETARSDFSPQSDEEWQEHKITINDYIRRLDETTAASRLEDDVVVTRGTATGRGIFGDALSGDLTGWSWNEDAYVSTTADPKISESFGGSGLVMRITVPRGTGAVRLSNVGGDAKKSVAAEAELLLQRGLKMRVVRDNGRDADGTRRLDVEVMS